MLVILNIVLNITTYVITARDHGTWPWHVTMFSIAPHTTYLFPPSIWTRIQSQNTKSTWQYFNSMYVFFSMHSIPMRYGYYGHVLLSCAMVTCHDHIFGLCTYVRTFIHTYTIVPRSRQVSNSYTYIHTDIHTHAIVSRSRQVSKSYTYVWHAYIHTYTHTY
jgi:hypothetical protein